MSRVEVGAFKYLRAPKPLERINWNTTENLIMKYKCSFCEKVFISEPNKKQHERSHCPRMKLAENTTMRGAYWRQPSTVAEKHGDNSVFTQCVSRIKDLTKRKQPTKGRKRLKSSPTINCKEVNSVLSEGRLIWCDELSKSSPTTKSSEVNLVSQKLKPSLSLVRTFFLLLRFADFIFLNKLTATVVAFTRFNRRNVAIYIRDNTVIHKMLCTLMKIMIKKFQKL
jgi:hypothetical protein